MFYIVIVRCLFNVNIYNQLEKSRHLRRSASCFFLVDFTTQSQSDAQKMVLCISGFSEKCKRENKEEKLSDASDCPNLRNRSPVSENDMKVFTCMASLFPKARKRT